MKNLILILVLTSCFTVGYSQSDTIKVFEKDIFANTQLVTSQTTEVLPEKTWEFKIQHRFGKIGLDSSLVTDFLGMDYTANIRISLGYSFSDRFYMAIGRTKTLKTYDIEGKYLFLKQNNLQKLPMSIAFFANVAIRTDRFPSIPDSAYFGDLTTDFIYKPSHRMSYNSQLIFSTKIHRAVSLQLTPILIYENLVAPGRDNLTFALNFGARFKTGIKSSILFEYGHVFNNRTHGFINPASLGFEIGSAGHVFQLYVTSTQDILDQRIYTNSSYNYGDAEFVLGFSIKRNMWRR